MGLLEISMESDEIPEISEKDALKNRAFVKKHWMLGPEKTNENNSEYWRDLSIVWRISPDQARRNLCANCEYFDDSPDTLAKMEVIPEDAYDKDGGGRGWCNKFDFICHTLRTCKAWEKAEQRTEESEYENGEEE
jgi:hypothetical protein